MSETHEQLKRYVQGEGESKVCHVNLTNPWYDSKIMSDCLEELEIALTLKFVSPLTPCQILVLNILKQQIGE